jgi:hypothetical protein
LQKHTATSPTKGFLALVLRARAPNPKSSKSNILLLVYAKSSFGSLFKPMAMDENITWNPTWQKWIMMGKFSKPIKNVEYRHFTKLFF